MRTADLAWAWFLAAFLLYSVSTRKLLNYLLPAVAPLYVLVGARLAAVLPYRPRFVAALPALLGAAVLVAAGLVALGLWFPLQTGRLPTAVNAPRWAPLAPYLAAAGAVLLAFAVVATRYRSAGGRAVLLMGAVLGAWWIGDRGMAQVAHLGSSRDLAAAIHQHRPPGEPVFTLKRYPQGLGYYGVSGVWIAGPQREIVDPYAAAHQLEEVMVAAPDPLEETPEAGGLLTIDSFNARWQSERRCLLVCRWREVELLGAHVLSGPHGGAGRTDLYLVTNRPPAEGGPK